MGEAETLLKMVTAAMPKQGSITTSSLSMGDPQDEPHQHK